MYISLHNNPTVVAVIILMTLIGFTVGLIIGLAYHRRQLDRDIVTCRRLMTDAQDRITKLNLILADALVQQRSEVKAAADQPSAFVMCPRCKAGWIDPQPCWLCRGSGVVVKKAQKKDVNIIEAIESAHKATAQSTLRFKGIDK